MNTKAIIIAAGKGSRLGHLTKDLPKCLAIRFEGRSLLEVQIKRLRSCCISEVVIVRGYCGDKFKIPGVHYIWNHDYERNNILESLMCAESGMFGDVLISYSDIWYDERIPKKLLNAQGDITLATDRDWEKNYEGRSQNPVSSSETVVVDENYRVLKLGRIGHKVPAIHGEFIGMMKMTDRGCSFFKEHYHRSKNNHSGKKFHHAEVFEKAYLSDLLQEMIDQGVRVEADMIDAEWKEIDTLEDYDNFKKYLATKKVSR